MTPSNSVIERLVSAINSGDRAGFLALLTPDAVLTDDGSQRHLNEWIDREIFTVNGHMTVDSEGEDGLLLNAHFRNDTWGEMQTFWRFRFRDEKISRIETGQAAK